MSGTGSEGAVVERVAVIGAGTMGHGIAQVCAQAGCEVRIYDPAPGACQKAFGRIRANLDKGVALGKLSGEERGAALRRIEPSTSVAAAVAGSDLVIEAVPESPAVKERVLAQVADAGDPHAVVATNTSSLSIGELARVFSDRSRFVGMHFFNPVHLMRLVEVVAGPETSEEALAQVVGFVERLGKEPILVADSPGFASSRLGVALGMEAIRMVEEGVATPAAIDKAMELGYRHPMGPLRLTDLVGLDVRLAIAEHLHGELGSATFEPPALLRSMVAEGKLGEKSGRGFYEWPGSGGRRDRGEGDRREAGGRRAPGSGNP